MPWLQVGSLNVGQRQAKPKACAAGTGAKADLPVHAFNQFTANGQAQAGTYDYLPVLGIFVGIGLVGRHKGGAICRDGQPRTAMPLIDRTR